MTEREKKGLGLLGLFGGLAVLVLGGNLLWDYFNAQEDRLRRLKLQISQLQLRAGTSEEGSLQKKVAELQENLWPSGSMTPLDLGELVKKTALREGLTITGGRLKSESTQGAFWEWQLLGPAPGFFRFLDHLENQPYPLIIRSLDLKRDVAGLKITLEVGYGLRS